MENSTPTPAPLPLDPGDLDTALEMILEGLKPGGLIGTRLAAKRQAHAVIAHLKAEAARRAGSPLVPAEGPVAARLLVLLDRVLDAKADEREAIVEEMKRDREVVAAIRSGSGSAPASPGPAGREEGDPILEAVKTMEHAAPSAHAMLRNNGIVFGGEGGQWEKTAFTLYTDLVELTEIARHALAAQPAAAPAAEQGNTSPTLNTEIKP